MTVAPNQATLEALQEIFRAQFLDDRMNITEATSPADIEEWDSLAHVSLLVAIEEALDIRFTADQMASIDSVSGILEVLNHSSD